MRKKARPSPFDKCYGKFLNLDMFGETINFNVQGRSHYNTCLGVFSTLAILVITVAYAYFGAMRA